MRTLKILLPLGFAVHLGITFWRTEAALAGRMVEFSPLVLGLALLLAFVPWATNSLRVWNWLRWVGTPRPLRECLRIVVASEIGAAVSPTSVGSASVKTAMLVRQGVALPRAVSITTLGSLEDGLFFVVVMPVLFVLSGVGHEGLLGRVTDAVARQFSSPWQPLLVLLGVVALAVAFLRSTGLGRRVVTVALQSLRDTRMLLVLASTQHARQTAINLALTCAQWIARNSIFTVLVLGLGAEIDPLRGLVLQWLCFTLMALIPTPGAMGGAELVFLALFAGELPAELLPLIMSAWRLATFYVLNGVGLLVLSLAPGSRGTWTAAIVPPPPDPSTGR